MHALLPLIPLFLLLSLSLGGILGVERGQKLFSLDERKLGSKGKQKFSLPQRVPLALFFFCCCCSSHVPRLNEVAVPCVFRIKYRERRGLERVARCLTNVYTCEACSDHDTR